MSEDTQWEWVRLSWKHTEEHSKNSTFWAVYRAFVDILVKAASLATAENSEMVENITQVVQDFCRIFQDIQ